MALYNTYTDTELLARLQKNDETAFTEIYDRYWEKLFVRAQVLLNSSEDAEEIVHDIFLTIWKKRDSLQIRHGFHTYIAAMLQYDCFRILADRKRKRFSKASASLPDIPDNNTQQYLDFESMRKELEAAVSRLPERCQLIFRLSREKGLSDKEIAEELHISVNTVHTQVRRALGSLKTSLDHFFLL